MKQIVSFSIMVFSSFKRIFTFLKSVIDSKVTPILVARSFFEAVNKLQIAFVVLHASRDVRTHTHTPHSARKKSSL